MAEAMHRAIAGSTLTVLEGARHLTPLEAPDTIAEQLSALTKSLNERRGTHA
jgi:3-oxoadipate enol-lactonase